MRRFFLFVFSAALLASGIWGTWHLVSEGHLGWLFFGAANCLWLGFYLFLHDFILPLLASKQFLKGEGQGSDCRLFSHEEIRLHSASGKLIEERRV